MRTGQFYCTIRCRVTQLAAVNAISTAKKAAFISPKVALRAVKIFGKYPSDGNLTCISTNNIADNSVILSPSRENSKI